MALLQKINLRNLVILFSAGILLIITIALFLIIRTWGRTLIQVDIHQNKKLIHLSNFAEPPQFAIWLEDPLTKELKHVFVTHRVAVGDWEGKANVPVALPQWYRLFKGNGNPAGSAGSARGDDLVVSGATPKQDYFSIRVEVKPDSEWICWIEMNLAGDFNEAFPEFDRELLVEDEFSNGQPALLFRADVRAVEQTSYVPVIAAQAIWDDGSVRIESVSDGITTARHIFDTVNISVIRPKPKLIDKYKIKESK